MSEVVQGNEAAAQRAMPEENESLDLVPPKAAMTAYVFFFHEKARQIQAQNPEMSPNDMMNIVSEEWDELHLNQKQRYLEMEKEDEERYDREYAAYKKKQEEAKGEEEEESEEEVQAPTSIPIFTERFLAYNELCETKLRNLHETHTWQEQWMSIYEKYYIVQKKGVKQDKKATLEQEKWNKKAIRDLQKLKLKYVEKFADVPLPGTNEVATEENVEEYVSKMNALIADGGNAEFISKVEGIISNLDIAFDDYIASDDDDSSNDDVTSGDE